MKEKLKLIKTIHIALCIGMVLAYVVIGQVQAIDFFRIPEIDSSSVIYLLIPVSAVFLGNFLYKQQLKNVDKGLRPEEKIGPYQTASLMRWGLLEGAAFLILFLKEELVLFGLMLILYMIFLKPSEQGMQRDFGSVGR